MSPLDQARRPVRVLIVDDSALMRKLLSEIVASTGEIEVAGIARDGDEAIREVARLRPDVVTLDVQMPGRSGVEILPDLLSACAVPVVMVSALTQEGAHVTLEALEAGAVDFMPKPERYQMSEMRHNGPLLVAKLLAAAQSRVRRSFRTARSGSPGSSHKARLIPESRQTPAYAGPTDAVAVIGISTGGPQTLAEHLPAVESPAPPILIVQHMPARFTAVFAERLNRECALPVKEAAHGDPVLPGQILVAPGGRHMRLEGRPPHVRIALGDESPVSGHRPSVDVLFTSAAEVYGQRTAAFIMTGMGRDGVDGCRAVLSAGGVAYGQDEATSIVYGMNKAAFLEGVVRSQFAPDELPTILRLLGRRPSGTA